MKRHKKTNANAVKRARTSKSKLSAGTVSSSAPTESNLSVKSPGIVPIGGNISEKTPTEIYNSWCFKYCPLCFLYDCWETLKQLLKESMPRGAQKQEETVQSCQYVSTGKGTIYRITVTTTANTAGTIKLYGVDYEPKKKKVKK